jgi:large subunit ribosomal protein L15
MPITRRVPKRGFTNPFREESQVVRLADLERVSGDITPESMQAAGLIDGAGSKFKILANGELKKAVKVKGVRLSAGAREKIVAAGGSVEE